MSTNQSDLFSALSDQLVNNISVLSPLTAADIQWPGEPFDPSTKATNGYLRLNVIPAETSPATLGDGTGALDHQEGILQIDAIVKTGGGVGAALVMADKVLTLFKRGTRLTKNSVTLVIRSASRGKHTEHQGWISVPAFLQYFSQTPV